MTDAQIQQAAQNCSDQAKLNFTAISSCQASKSGVDKLLSDAAATFAKMWPNHTLPSENYEVPHVLIDGKEVADHNVSAMLADLCAANIQAACKKHGGVEAGIEVV